MSNWLDPKKYKHVRSDDKTTVLRHEHGHEIHIATHALSPKMQEQLKALANSPSEGVKKMADGGTIDVDTTDNVPSAHTTGPFPEFDAQKAAAANPELSPDKLQAAQERLDQHNKLVNMGLAQPDSLPVQAPDAGQPQNFTKPSDAPVAPPATMPDQSAPQGASSPMAGMPSPEGDLRKALSLQNQGAEQQAKAEADLGKARSDVLQSSMEARAQAQQHFNDEYKRIGADIDATVQDIKEGHISPENYWKDHSKLATGLGIILAGFNPTSNPNAALQFLNQQMDRNLDAQKAEIGKKNNLLSAYYHQMGNLKDATEMTRLTQAGIIADKMDQAAATAANPMAKAAMLQKKGEWLHQYAPQFQAFAMQRAIMNAVNQGGGNPESIGHMIDQIGVLDPARAKDMRERYVPGVGLASKPIPEKTMGELKAHKDFDMAAKDLQQWTKTHTTLVPGTADFTTGEQKAMQLQAMIRESLLNTVYREGEQPLLDKMIKGNPANFLKQYNTLPQLKELIRSNNARLQTLKSSYGLPTGNGSQPGVQSEGYKPKSFKPVGK